MTLAYGTRQPCDTALMREQRPPVACPARDKPWVLVTAILGSSLAFIEGSVVNLALPSLQAHFQANSTELQWVVNAYLLALGAFMLIGGSLGDRFGLRRIFLVGTAIFGTASLACAVAPSLGILIAFRLVQGFGAALLVPSSLALIGTHFETGERGRAIGTWAGASALTTAVGPVLGGWLVDQWSWPAVFLLIAPLAAITFSVGLWRVPRSLPQTRAALDYPGAVLLAATLSLMIYALVGAMRPLPRLAIALAVIVLGLAFLKRESRIARPMLPLDLFRSRSFSGANAMTLLLYCALSGALYFLPFNLIQVQGYSATTAGAAFLPFTIILGFGSRFAGQLVERFNPRTLLTAGPAITAAGFFVMAIPGVDSDLASGFLPAIVVIGVGMTLSVTPLTTVVMNAVGERQTGIASGINNTAARLAGVVAVAGLTALAVSLFSTRLALELQQTDVPAQLVAELQQQASALGELRAPATASAGTTATVSKAVAHAYVSAFRVLVSVCGGLALLSSLIAWLSIPRGFSSSDG
jgi:EmrB/QacA subfamily drug resistance transporter